MFIILADFQIQYSTFFQIVIMIFEKKKKKKMNMYFPPYAMYLVPYSGPTLAPLPFGSTAVYILFNHN